MTAIKRYTVGERIQGWPVTSWNEMADRVEGPVGLQEQNFSENGGLVKVKNISSVDIPKGGVMQPTGSMVDISQQEYAVNLGPLISVDEPDTSTGAEATYMIAVNPIQAGNLGAGVRYGHVWARVDVNNTGDDYAIVIDGDADKLESTSSVSRARIIEKESGTGEKWALLDLGSASSDAIILPHLTDTFSFATSELIDSLINTSSVVQGLKSNADIFAEYDSISNHWDLTNGHHYLVEVGVTLDQVSGWTAYNPPTTYIENMQVALVLENGAHSTEFAPRVELNTNEISNFISGPIVMNGSIFIYAADSTPWIYPYIQMSQGHGITTQEINGSGWIQIAHIDNRTYVAQ